MMGKASQQRQSLSSLSVQLMLANCTLFAATPTLGQDAQAAATAISINAIDEAPLLSTRAAGMAGALSTNADDLDAATLNPAGIGGLRLNLGKEKIPFTRKLYFPWVAGSLDKNSSELRNSFSKEGGADDPAVAQSIIDAAGGESQYARANILVGMVNGRTLIAPFADQQIAAVSQGDSGLIDMRYRSLSGLAYGFSATDPQERFAIGYSGFLINRKDTVGTFNYLDMIDKSTRSKVLKENSTTYESTMVHNAGLTWTLAKTARPIVAVAVKNVGDTVYTAKTSANSENAAAEDLTVKQDVTLGFSVTPQLGHYLSWGFSVEGQHLIDTNDDYADRKKYRLGTEMLFGSRTGSYARLGARAGYSDAGSSVGLSLNLGLLAFEAAQQSVDIGIGSDKVIERRVTGTFYVNVADF